MEESGSDSVEGHGLLPKETKDLVQSLDSERFPDKAAEGYRKALEWARRSDADILKGVLPESEQRDEIIRFWRLKELTRQYFESLEIAQI